jgi:hypothetical protein
MLSAIEDCRSSGDTKNNQRIGSFIPAWLVDAEAFYQRLCLFLASGIQSLRLSRDSGAYESQSFQRLINGIISSLGNHPELFEQKYLGSIARQHGLLQANPNPVFRNDPYPEAALAVLPFDTECSSIERTPFIGNLILNHACHART